MEAGINPTLIILAGGKSTRMGEDKALMFDNTSRIQKIAENLGVNDCIILCGDKKGRSYSKAMFGWTQYLLTAFSILSFGFQNKSREGFS